MMNVLNKLNSSIFPGFIVKMFWSIVKLWRVADAPDTTLLIENTAAYAVLCLHISDMSGSSFNHTGFM